ncbi:enoyl-CoA delta isomerase 1, mitochondrial-like isoform X2 [Zophobas morio]|uniref:enoyl-CoA delta isomerase 1, mitochondrial-like isoform X2 n=1 Tax=Zophobas morio TaxID=2755281 RepID=UPI003083B65A
MALRTARNLAYCLNSIRNYSTNGPLVNVTVNEKSGFATVTLQNPPVNSMNLELLTEISHTLQQLEKNKCRGLILTSASNKVFSAGIDIFELHKPNSDRISQTWSFVQEIWIRLYGSAYPTVAVINGHATAGGCLLTLASEYRIMLNKFTIGLNETQVGLTPPTWLIDAMKNTIGGKQTEFALTAGTLFETEEALKIGLVDEVAQSKHDAIEKAEKFLNKFKRIPPHARSITKAKLRGANIQAV